MDNNDVYVNIGQRIKAKRIEMGLSQEKLAELVGYKSRSTINKIELGINDIPQSKIIDFAKALNTTPAYLIGCEKQQQEWDLKYNSNNTLSIETKLLEQIQCSYGKKVVQLLELFNQLNAAGQDKALETLTDFTMIEKYTEK